MMHRTNSKATLRVKFNDLSMLPKLILEQLQSSRYYADGSGSLVIQADTSRRQSDNKDECFAKLDHLVRLAGKTVVKGETSPEQQAKVKKL